MEIIIHILDDADILLLSFGVRGGHSSTNCFPSFQLWGAGGQFLYPHVKKIRNFHPHRRPGRGEGGGQWAF